MKTHIITSKIESFEGVEDGTKVVLFFDTTDFLITFIGPGGTSESLLSHGVTFFTLTPEEYAKLETNGYTAELSADKNSATFTEKPGQHSKIIDKIDGSPMNNINSFKLKYRLARAHNTGTPDDDLELELFSEHACCQIMKELVLATPSAKTYRISYDGIYFDENALKQYEIDAHKFLNEWLPKDDDGDVTHAFTGVSNPTYVATTEWNLVLEGIRNSNYIPGTTKWQDLVKDILWTNRLQIARLWNNSQLSVVEEDGNLKITARCVSNLTYSGNVIAEFVGREQKEFIVAKDPVEGTIVSALNQDGATITAPEPVEGQ